jgi:hypothetical protein
MSDKNKAEPAIISPETALQKHLKNTLESEKRTEHGARTPAPQAKGAHPAAPPKKNPVQSSPPPTRERKDEETG